MKRIEVVLDDEAEGILDFFVTRRRVYKDIVVSEGLKELYNVYQSEKISPRVPVVDVDGNPRGADISKL